MTYIIDFDREDKVKKITLVKDKDKIIIDIDERLSFEDIMKMFAELILKMRILHIKRYL